MLALSSADKTLRKEFESFWYLLLYHRSFNRNDTFLPKTLIKEISRQSFLLIETTNNDQLTFRVTNFVVLQLVATLSKSKTFQMLRSGTFFQKQDNFVRKLIIISRYFVSKWNQMKVEVTNASLLSEGPFDALNNKITCTGFRI